MFVKVASGYVEVPTEWEEGVQVPGAGVTGSSELSDECLDLNLGPLEEQQVVLNTKPALQAMQKRIFSCLPS